MGLRASMSEVAYFGNAQRIIVALRMLVTPLVTSIYPYISQKAARSEEEAVRFLRKYSLLLSLPFLLISLGLLAAAPLVVVFLGKGYAPAVPLLRIMAFSPFMLALSHCFSTYYMLAFGYEKQWARILFVAVVVNFALLIPLLAFLRPSVALAVVWIALDIFQTSAYFIFYRRHSQDQLAGAS
jgi:O-antigen/teichoic acid export membrane protein